MEEDLVQSSDLLRAQIFLDLRRLLLHNLQLSDQFRVAELRVL
jgi:hypothetical protein